MTIVLGEGLFGELRYRSCSGEGWRGPGTLSFDDGTACVIYRA